MSPALPWWQTLIVALFLAASMGTLAAAATADPGFVPRAVPPPDAWAPPRPPAPTVTLENGGTITLKWCATCAHYRPPRTSHCAVCDNCVRGFDHHCPWVGQCVGARNYRFFLAFVYVTAGLCVAVQALCWARLADRARALGNISLAVAREPWALALAFYCLLALAFVGGLSGFHTYLASNATTTYEHFRGRGGGSGRHSRHNPYERGCARNWVAVCCSRLPPRLPEVRPAADAAVALGLAPRRAWPPVPGVGGGVDAGALPPAVAVDGAGEAAALPPPPPPPPPVAVSYGFGSAAEAALAEMQARRASAAAEAASAAEAPRYAPPASPLRAVLAGPVAAARSLRAAFASAAEEEEASDEEEGASTLDSQSDSPPVPPPPVRPPTPPLTSPLDSPAMVTAPGSLAAPSLASCDGAATPPRPPASTAPRSPAAHDLLLSPAHEPSPPRRGRGRE